MPPLILNYSTPETLKSLTAIEAYYELEPIEVASSTVFTRNRKMSLNLRIFKLIDEYSRLDNNWDGDDALTPHPNAINQARFLANFLETHGQPIYHTAPGPNGEIMMDIRNRTNTRSLEIIFYADKNVAVFLPKDAKPWQQSFDILQLSKFLTWVNQEQIQKKECE